VANPIGISTKRILTFSNDSDLSLAYFRLEMAVCPEVGLAILSSSGELKCLSNHSSKNRQSAVGLLGCNAMKAGAISAYLGRKDIRESLRAMLLCDSNSLLRNCEAKYFEEYNQYYSFGDCCSFSGVDFAFRNYDMGEREC
jgi:hypothetical protein